MTKKHVALLALIFLFSSTMFAAPKVMLQLKLQKGSTYEMSMNATNVIDQDMMGQKMKITQKMDLISSYTVLDVLPDNKFRVAYSFNRMKIYMDMGGQEITMDSESADDNTMNASLKDMVSMKLTLTLNQKGQLEKVEGLEEFAKKLSANPQMAQSMQMFSDENSFKSFFAQSFNYFPEDKVSTGDKWQSVVKMPALMNTEITLQFEVAAIENSQVLLNVASLIDIESPIEQMGMKMNMSAKGTQKGIMAIDETDGWLRNSELTQNFDMKMKLKNPQSGEDMVIPVIMNSVTKVSTTKK